jgi:hypothetical protein
MSRSYKSIEFLTITSQKPIDEICVVAYDSK